ncbi:dipeptidyl-peptidase-4 [Dysgonomonas alginatilytica]|uniref:Dipeptidyl-peptidase-4 n=1 Tax=Dysgonomonas alginatilytica TaxID=1605892 RepID=A0A2V3PLX6_9BACT|nr:S9 family peptidase [Dysgonomonas alginatilytica]PXV62838.1 dipeptidyl-peptidase-4 [Dysgonomonas alginatilytica]
MKILKTCFLSIFTLSSFISMAQDTSIQLGLEDLIPGGNSYAKYRISFPQKLQWWGDNLTYIKGDSILSVAKSKEQTDNLIIDKKTINAGLEASNKKTIKSLLSVSFPYADEKIVMLTNGDETYLYNFESNKVITDYTLSKDGTNQDFSEKSKTFAYTKDNNLYIISPSGQEVAVTTDTDKGIVNGQSVHRNEFGIKKGTFWSPSGKQLAFYRMDETMVTDYPLVNISERVAELKNIKYPMAGMKSHHVTVGIFNPETQQTVFLKTGTPKEKYLTNIAWSPDEKYIYLAELNRGQDTCKLNRYEVASGKLDATLFTETHPKYVEPENPVLFLKSDPQSFIWQSKKDGHNHLYQYDLNGNLKKQLTTGNWDIIEILGFDEAGNNLYYISTEISPIEKHIYQLNLKNGKRTQLSKEEGAHSAQLSSSGKYIADRYTSQHNPGKVSITETKTNKSYTFFEAKDPYSKINMPEIEIGFIKANDDKTDLYYRLIKPLNYDPAKKYPTVIYVYGGPHSQLVDNSWMGQARGWDIYMAEKGYVVFTIDNRGTSNRGIDFENITHRQLGIIETEDQMTGVNFLKSLPYVDSDRIGVHGWSYGGFMTLNLMLRHPETFKVGVAGGPVTDWKYYEIMYGERYMDSPKENPEGYSKTSMVDRAGDLKGRLLLIHGDEDPTVVLQHNLQFMKSAIKNGTHPDLFIYPGHGHNMTGHDRVHLHEHITRYFDNFLESL